MKIYRIGPIVAKNDGTATGFSAFILKIQKIPAICVLFLFW
jgi:hypothetical protein